MTGYIKLYRDIMDSDIWKSKEPFDYRSAWIDLLLLASHKDHDIFGKGKLIKSKRGQVNRSLQQLADRWHWKSRGRVKRFLAELEAAQMVNTICTSNGTVITIENYSKWQDARNSKRNTDGHQTDIKRTSNGTQTDTYKNGKEGERMIKNGEKGDASEQGTITHLFRNGVAPLTSEESDAIVNALKEGARR